MQRPSLLDFALLLTLSLMWGSSFMFIELALASFAPLSLAAARIMIAALFLWAFARLTGHRLPLGRRTWQIAAAVGFVGLVLPFTLIGWAQQEIESSRAAIIMASTPLSTMLLAHFATADEKLAARRVTGLMLGLVGVAILLGGAGVDDIATAGLRQLAVLLATIGYAISSIMLRSLSHIPPLSVSAAVMISASVMTLPLALLIDRGPIAEITPLSGMAALYLGIFSSALGIVVMLKLINRVGVTFMSMNNYLVPAIGVLWGAILLDETITAETIGAFALILAGVAVASLGGRRRRPRADSGPG